MNRVLTVLVALIIILSPGGVIGKEQKKVFASYSLSGAKDTVRLVKEVKTGEELLPGNYNVKAKLSLKSENKEVVLNSLHFEFPENSNSSKEIFQQGWTSFSKSYFWNPISEENVLTIPLSLKSIDKNTSITDFDELRIDYQDLFLDNPSKLGIQMLVTGKTLNKMTTILGHEAGERQLTPIKKLDISPTSWKEKDSSYLAKRTLGLPFDDTWRHSRSGSNTVFQRRFHLSLDSFEAIDLVVQPGATASQISSLICNFRIENEILEWNSVPRQILNIQGQKVVRIDFGQYVQNQFGKRRGMHLEEMIFFLPGKTSEVLRSPILKTINFLALDKSQPLGAENENMEKDTDSPKRIDRILNLSSRIENLPQNRKRLAVDIGKLHDELDGSAKIHSMTLIARPKNPESTTGFDLQSARAVSLGVKKWPIFLKAGKQLTHQWGGPFLDLSDENHNVEWPQVLAYLSFHKGRRKGLPQILDDKQKKDVEGQSANKNPDEQKNLFTDEKIELPTGKKIIGPVQFRGATIHVHPLPSSWISKRDGLILEGEEGDWVEIYWPLQVNIKKNTQFFLGISDGAKAIRSIQVTPLYRGRQLKQVVGQPNHPFHLDVSAREIDGLKIRMMLSKNLFELKLEEMAIFQPMGLTPVQAVDASRLVFGEFPLTPKDVVSPSGTQVSIRRGSIRAIMFPKDHSPTTLTWTTDIGRNFGEIQSVKINYQVPQEVVAKDPCWLQLTLIGSEHQVNQTVCPQLASGQMVIPADDLFHDTPIPSDEVIKSITWNINFEGHKDSRRRPLTLAMSMAMEGMGIRKLRSELVKHSVLEWHGQKIFPTSLTDKPAIDLLSGQNFVNLGHLSIKDASDAYLDLKFSGHPHLDVRTVVLEKSDPISPKVWASLMETDHPPPPPFRPFLSKLFPPLITFALLWWGWKRSWHKRLWNWQKNWSVFVWSRISTLCHRSLRIITEKRVLLNRVVGFILLGPGLLAAGWFWEQGAGKFCLGAIIGLFIGVLWHELRWWFLAPPKILSKTDGTDDPTTVSPSKQQEKNGALFKKWMFGRNEKLPPFLYLVAVLALSYVSFNLGYGNDLVLSLLPPLGVIYFYTPWLPWFFKGKVRTWITITTGLYLMGILALLIKWRGGTDFFFSFAAISAVLAWRNLTPYLRPKLEQHWPSLADKVYGGAGTHYIAGFLVTLVMSAFFLIIKLEPVAEQIAVVGYFMLVTGVVLEARALRKKPAGDESYDSSKVVENEAPRA